MRALVDMNDAQVDALDTLAKHPGARAPAGASARGVFVRSTTLSTVSRGERAATLGVP